MRPRRPLARLLPLIAALALVALVAAEAQETTRIFFPVVASPPGTPRPSTSPVTPTGLAGTATATATTTTTATASTTATTTTTMPAGVDVSGSVRLRPEAASYARLTARPHRYVIVLDVSGSMNMNFVGKGTHPTSGEDVQCASGDGVTPIQPGCATPAYAWDVVEERRIYIAKTAAIALIESLNMPGNTGYTAQLPADKVTLIWFDEGAPASARFPATGTEGSSDPAALKAAVLQAGAFQGDPYKIEGGGNAAAGLYRASQFLREAPATLELPGKSLPYRNYVVLAGDGVANHFLDPASPTLAGGPSGPDTYPQGSLCRTLGQAVNETSLCQTTEGGGLYRGADRPITQMVKVALQIKSDLAAPAEIFVLGLANDPATGLADGVASSPSYYFPIRTIEVDPQTGASNLDQIVSRLVTRVVQEVVPPPQRYAIVLDVSGSQNATFSGIGSDPITAADVQCTNGPNDEPILNCGKPEYAYRVVSQRRIYVQKEAAIRFIRQLNMPGNQGYDPGRPKDQAIVVWYNDGAPANAARRPTSDPTALEQAVLQAGAVGGDPYKTQGGTNWGAGLYRAYQALAAAPASTNELGTTFDYDEQVIFVTDGVSNFFLDQASATLRGGESGPSTYPAGTRCKSLLEIVREDAVCQTTDGGGKYNGKDRPITQAVQVSREQLQAIPGRPVDVYAIALSNFPSTGLEAGVASAPAYFFAARELSLEAGGVTNVDRIFDAILARERSAVCQRVVAGPWVETVAEANLPQAPNLTPPTVGEVVLRSATTSAQYRAPVVREAATGRLGFQLADVPPGSYQLSAYTFYRGDDGLTRVYGRLYQAEEPAPNILVELAGAARDLGALSLLLSGDVCAAP